jgi:hypothetical protein
MTPPTFDPARPLPRFTPEDLAQIFTQARIALEGEPAPAQGITEPVAQAPAKPVAARQVRSLRQSDR